MVMGCLLYFFDFDIDHIKTAAARSKTKNISFQKVPSRISRLIGHCILVLLSFMLFFDPQLSFFHESLYFSTWWKGVGRYSIAPIVSQGNQIFVSPERRPFAGVP